MKVFLDSAKSRGFTKILSLDHQELVAITVEHPWLLVDPD